MFRIAFIFSILFHSQSLFSWCDAGHMVVAEIAYRQLTDAAKCKVDAFNDLAYKNFDNIHSAATYPDKARDLGYWSWDVWHFTNIPFDPKSILTLEDKKRIREENERHDVVFGVEEAFRCLSQEPNWFMFAYLLHYVADIHQPLHCMSRYSEEWQEGDRGGNLFPLLGMEQKNLHTFWDFVLGSLPEKITNNFICKKADELMDKYPFDIEITNPKSWAIESASYGDVVYSLEENTTPNLAYINKCQAIAEERLTVAGYRLGLLLNQLFSK